MTSNRSRQTSLEHLTSAIVMPSVSTTTPCATATKAEQGSLPTHVRPGGGGNPSLVGNGRAFPIRNVKDKVGLKSGDNHYCLGTCSGDKKRERR